MGLKAITLLQYINPIEGLVRNTNDDQIKAGNMELTNFDGAAIVTQAISAEARMVRNALVAEGLETPLLPNKLSRDEKYQRLRSAFEDVLNTLELDLTDDSLRETPERIARMYVDEIFSGLDYTRFPKISVIENKMRLDEMVVVDDIGVTSTCEHHFVTIDGSARVAYIPKDKIIGLSKINRVVRFFAQRPQVQERMTKQILLTLQTLLETDDVAVTVDAAHYCVKARGVMDASSRTRTIALGGEFKLNSRSRDEFMR
ncbi:MAG: GTP cyclohydrolase I [Halieaceae bacterium]|jgi:GTP cyclohydrolase I